MKLFALGVSHKTAPVKLREQLSVQRSEHVDLARTLKSHGGLDEVVLLSTCNRVEIYGTTQGTTRDIKSLFRFFSSDARCFDSHIYIHEDVDAAVMSGAAGVHLRSAGNPEAARARLPDGLIGASAHSAEEAAALLGSGADYVTLSPVFPTASKPGYGPAIGLDGLAEIIAQVPGPVIALGGVTPADAPLCLSAGASGVAVMGEVMRATDPKSVVEAMLAAMSDPNKICG